MFHCTHSPVETIHWAVGWVLDLLTQSAVSHTWWCEWVVIMIMIIFVIAEVGPVAAVKQKGLVHADSWEV